MIDGVADDGVVTILAFGQGTADEAGIEALSRLARKFDLELVYWCRCARAGRGDPLFRPLLTGAV